MSEQNGKWKCKACDRELVLRAADFEYLGQTFQTELLRCPVCGQVYIPPELVDGKMAEVEMIMEDK